MLAENFRLKIKPATVWDLTVTLEGDKTEHKTWLQPVGLWIEIEPLPAGTVY